MEEFNPSIINKNNFQTEINNLAANTKSQASNILDSKNPKEIFERIKLENNPPLATKEQIIWLYNQAILHESFLSYRKWSIFTEAFNEARWNVKKFWFKMPLCYYTIINLLWWDYNISTKKKYVLDLINKS